MPTPPPDRSDGIDVTGGGKPPTGDPFLDEALREAAEDWNSGIHRDVRWVMERSDEIFEQRYPDAGDGIYREHISRDDAISMVSALVEGFKVSGGWVAKETFAEEVEQRVAFNLAVGGWVHVSALEMNIESAGRKQAAVESHNHAVLTMRCYKHMMLAMLNGLLIICLPMPWKAYYGLLFGSVAMVVVHRLSKSFDLMIKKAEIEVRVPVEKTTLSKKLAEEIVAKRGITRSTFDLADDQKPEWYKGALLNDETITELRKRLKLKDPR